MITMDENRIVLLVQNNRHNRMHNGLGNLDLFGTLHINDTVADTMVLDERCKMFREWVSLDEGAV